MKRIKHNDLLPWFTRGSQGPASSVPEELPEFFGDSLKQLAPSSEPQASSNKQRKGKNVRNFYNFY
jgi:hypothetical protein